MLRLKRVLDRLFFANQAFFAGATLNAYAKYMATLYQTFAAPGQNARLRTGLLSGHGHRRQAYGDGWDPRWDELFAVEGERSAPEAVEAAYQDLLQRLSAEVGA